jgi:hypothetical protein
MTEAYVCPEGEAQSLATGGTTMQLDKKFVLDELRKAGQDKHVEDAIKELPEKIDHDQHAALLQRFGLDPGKLAQRAAERGLASL